MKFFLLALMLAFPVASKAIGGIYYDPDFDGEGLIIAEGPTDTLAWYYGFDGAGAPMWYSGPCMGTVESGRPGMDVTCKLRQYRSGAAYAAVDVYGWTGLVVSFSLPAEGGTIQALLEFIICPVGCFERSIFGARDFVLLAPLASD